KEMLEKDRHDRSIYKIKLCNFSSARYYKQILVVLQAESKSISGMAVEHDDGIGLIALSFASDDAVEAFAKRLPLGFSESDDSYEFVEDRRNVISGRWELVEDPIMWREDEA